MTSEELEAAVAALAADRASGASGLVARAVALLRQVRDAEPALLVRAAVLVCRAQPSMAPLWNAAGLALADAGDKGTRLERFAAQAARSLTAIARVASDLIEADLVGERRIVTWSSSASVRAACHAIAGRGPVRVACAEGRPALEGRQLAASLAAAGLAVELYSDAGLGGCLPGSTAVLVGADTVAPGWFINKCGTAALAALAVHAGVPVYLLAGRDKFLPAELTGRVSLSGGPPAEIWEAPPPGVAVRNPYFESIPLDLVAALVTDAGVVGTGLASEVCEANSRLMGPGAERLSSLAAAP